MFPEPEKDDDIWTGSWARPLYPPPDDPDSPTTLPQRTARRTAAAAEGGHSRPGPAADRQPGDGFTARTRKPARSEATGYDLPLPTVRRPRRPAAAGPLSAAPAPGQSAVPDPGGDQPYDPAGPDPRPAAAESAALRRPPPAYPAPSAPGGPPHRQSQAPLPPPPAAPRGSHPDAAPEKTSSRMPPSGPTEAAAPGAAPSEWSWPAVRQPAQPQPGMSDSGAARPRTDRLPPPRSAADQPPPPVVRTPAPQPWTAPFDQGAGGHAASTRPDSAEPEPAAPPGPLPVAPRRSDRWAGLRPPGPSLAEAADRAASSLWTPHVPVRPTDAAAPGTSTHWVGGADENDALNPFGGGASREVLRTPGWETPDPLGPTPAPERSLPPTAGAASGVFEELQLLRPYDPSGAQPWRAEDGYPPDWPYRRNPAQANPPAAVSARAPDGTGSADTRSEDTGMDWTALQPAGQDGAGPEPPAGHAHDEIPGARPPAAPALPPVRPRPEVPGTGSLGQDGVTARPTLPAIGGVGQDVGRESGLSAWDRLRRSPTVDGSDPGFAAPPPAAGTSSSVSPPAQRPAVPGTGSPGAGSPEATPPVPVAPASGLPAVPPSTRRMPSFSGSPGAADPDTFSDLSAPVPMPRGEAGPGGPPRLTTTPRRMSADPATGLHLPGSEPSVVGRRGPAPLPAAPTPAPDAPAMPSDGAVTGFMPLPLRTDATGRGPRPAASPPGEADASRSSGTGARPVPTPANAPGDRLRPTPLPSSSGATPQSAPGRRALRRDAAQGPLPGLPEASGWEWNSLYRPPAGREGSATGTQPIAGMAIRVNWESQLGDGRDPAADDHPDGVGENRFAEPVDGPDTYRIPGAAGGFQEEQTSAPLRRPAGRGEPGEPEPSIGAAFRPAADPWAARSAAAAWDHDPASGYGAGERPWGRPDGEGEWEELDDPFSDPAGTGSGRGRRKAVMAAAAAAIVVAGVSVAVKAGIFGHDPSGPVSAAGLTTTTGSSAPDGTGGPLVTAADGTPANDFGAGLPMVSLPAGPVRPGKVLATYAVKIAVGLPVNAQDYPNRIDQVLNSPKGWAANSGRVFRQVTADQLPNITIYLVSAQDMPNACAVLGHQVTTATPSCLGSANQLVINLSAWQSSAPQTGLSVVPATDYQAYLLNSGVGRMYVNSGFPAACTGTSTSPGTVLDPVPASGVPCTVRAWPTAEEALRFRSRALG